MTVSMSALSKLSTMKRPRWAAGVGGTVGGAAGGGGVGTGAGCATTRGGSAGAGSVRGPTEILVGGGSTVVVTVGAGAGGNGGVWARGVVDDVAHPPVRARRTTATILPFTSLLRAIGGRPLRESTQEIRGQRTASRNDGRRSGLHGLAGLHHGTGRLRHERAGRDRTGRRRDDAGEHLAAGDGLGGARHSRDGRPWRRPRLAGIAQTDVHVAVDAVDHHAVGADGLHGAAGDGITHAIAGHALRVRVFQVGDRRAV